ncbi:MAG: response regulator transcription factor [Clostridiales bacterium]|nr:response regulator transcription factor [Clostridiales bacterium]
MSHKVVIAEDFMMIRQVFEGIINASSDFELLRSFDNAEDALAFCKTASVDILLTDVLMPGGISGLDASRELKKVRPEIKIVMVTSMPELSYIRQAQEIGVESFWYKEVQEQPLLEVLQRTIEGENVYPSSRPKVALGNIFSTDLTDREADVLRELVSGASNKEIAETLNIAEKTVKMHVTNMLQKTGYHSRLELAVRARHYGIAIKD